jgi:hypothetical protein
MAAHPSIRPSALQPGRRATAPDAIAAGMLVGGMAGALGGMVLGVLVYGTDLFVPVLIAIVAAVTGAVVGGAGAARRVRLQAAERRLAAREARRAPRAG